MACPAVRRLLLGFLLLAARPQSGAAESPEGSQGVVVAEELLQIDYLNPAGHFLPLDPAPDARTKRSGGTVYVRVGKDGYARFPLTERWLPFAELELPVVEAMLATHLQLNGHPEAKVTVTRPPEGLNLVTVLGFVAKPGVYELPRTATLADAVAAAGGLTRLDQPAAEPTPLNDISEFNERRLDSPFEPAPNPRPVAEAKHFQLAVRHPDYDLPARGGSVVAPGIILVEQPRWE